MSFPKILAIIAVILFSIIGIAALYKGDRNISNAPSSNVAAPLEIELDHEIRIVSAPTPIPQHEYKQDTNQDFKQESPQKNALIPPLKTSSATKPLPDANRIEELFNKTEPKLPFVQTIIYKSHVNWQKGRPAWLSDYAAHYSTSRHFIARSLNGKADYFKQNISEGDRFNVFHPEKNITFYLLIDTSRSKLWFYSLDKDTNERVLLRTYNVGLGRVDSSKASGLLTPLGKYAIGNKIAIYKPKTIGIHHGQKIEMIKVFGTRWIPFEKEIESCTAPAAGIGLHGVPWVPNSQGELVEDSSSLGKYESDGCVRLATQDIEEIFAIIITRPTTIELVKDFYESKFVEQ